MQAVDRAYGDEVKLARHRVICCLVAVMRLKTTLSPAFHNKGSSSLCRIRLVDIFLALMAATCQLVSSAHTASESSENRWGGAVQSAAIPVGYILPVQLERTVSIKNARVGDALAARIMQEVPLPNGRKIASRSLVKGSVLIVTRDEDETGVELTVRFDALNQRGQILQLVTSLRAIASYMAVHDAGMPVSVYDEQTPLTWASTYQIGGDERFGDGGAVRNRWRETVGKAVRGGVMVHLKANPERGCEGAIGPEDHPQALWLFSADACGVYGLKGVQLVSSGQSSPVGEITLHFKKADMRLNAGTGMLLRVVSAP